VRKLKPDFLVCSAYKWLLCPYGFGFLYVAPHRQDGGPLEEHFFHRAGVQGHEGRLEQLEGYDSGARRFDTTERASFINVAMSVVALSELSGWSVTGSSRVSPRSPMRSSPAPDGMAIARLSLASAPLWLPKTPPSRR
jgi:hypothetical protein